MTPAEHRESIIRRVRNMTLRESFWALEHLFKHPMLRQTFPLAAAEFDEKLPSAQRRWQKLDLEANTLDIENPPDD